LPVTPLPVNSGSLVDLSSVSLGDTAASHEAFPKEFPGGRVARSE
jgi:hypothetical protein